MKTIGDSYKTCKKCKELKLHSEKGTKCKSCIREYGQEYNIKNKDIISSKMKLKRKQCPDYVRKHLYQKKYGITIEDYNNLFIKQNGKCAICKSSFTGRGSPIFDVDHCHETGIVRGLLCVKCNLGLGSFKDNIDALSEAINYLKNNAYAHNRATYQQLARADETVQ